ncbi:PIN domain nuclease, a component of toxin-antitoxin system (PIN domain) [Bryocella elongata]|uniref:PIN domain nuclease, a component of toxin-antitoxin system (PIN domain) n=1 Tax=Bryocella elongata TaxID=863522 RepID=A0A1H6BJM1_9BACT|nr:type II toxin-antitoxin system VapC family toxin [Bryocella elongata]SEG60854.1 PIN domain nuclease, a component of toxin-antitoxin system (PIN domain) [Bryocella elongata]
MNAEPKRTVNKVVLDASVILALLKEERIDERALDLVQGGYMSAVNVAEVFSKLSDLGPSPSEAMEKISALLELLEEIVPFTNGQARTAGALRESTRHLGLSLGDRACLALAIALQADVYTVDLNWLSLGISGINIKALR